MNRFERKKRTTEEKLQAALMKLMGKKSFPDITVSELCRAADVNRTTFYAHYRSTVDALEALEAQLIRKFLARMEEVIPSGTKLTWAAAQNMELAVAALSYVKEHRNEYRLYHSLTAFHKAEHRKDMFETIFVPWLTSCGETDRNRMKYEMHYYLGGVHALVERWLSRDCAEPVEEIAALIRRVMTGPGTETEEQQ